MCEMIPKNKIPGGAGLLCEALWDETDTSGMAVWSLPGMIASGEDRRSDCK